MKEELTIQERTKELVETQARLVKSERLATIGELAGMVGHDIRNPLQAIVGDVYLLKEDLKSMPEREEKNNAEESLLGIEKNVDYINKIVADLLALMTKMHPDKSNYIALITGPSKTADIERVLAIGVHGPERLVIVCVDELGGTSS